MAKRYQYKASLNILQGGYAGEEYGVSPTDTSWHEADISSEQTTRNHTYYYRDSGCGDNNNSSKVSLTVYDVWTTSVDNRNNLTITVTTTIAGIYRDSLIGNPNACGTIPVRIHIRRERNGSDIAVFPSATGWMNMATTGTISEAFSLGTYTFTLAPGQNLSRGTFYLYNDAQSGYDDEMEMGISFKNILPADYRPGMILKDGAWLSHNRDVGEAHILNSNWKEMRTLDGHNTNDNPPSIRMNSKWTDQLLIGKE